MTKKKVEELSAKVSVEDKASKEFERIAKSVQKTQNELMRMKVSMEKLRQQGNRKVKVDVDTKPAIANVSRLERSFRTLMRVGQETSRLFGGLGSTLSRFTPSGLTGLIGAIGGGYAAKTAFDSTFLKAAEFKMSAKTIEAMFNDKAKSDLYIKQMEQMAIGSPLLNSQDIFGNSKSFIALSKDQGQLNEMWDLAERLLAVDPKQGVEGSVFALRELFSGDSRSMAERFELSKSVLNGIKDLPIEKQLKELDKYFNKMGMTKKLVNAMGDETLGIWAQIKETMESGLRKIGEPAEEIIKPLLNDINKAMQGDKLNKFIKIGQDIASSIASGFVGAARGIGSWIEGIANDPEFKKLNGLQAKVDFVFADIYERFNAWYEETGSGLLESITDSLMKSIATSIENNIGPISIAAIKVGSSIASGIVSGISSNPVIATLAGAGLGGMIGGPLGALLGAGAGIGVSAGSAINKALSNGEKKQNKKISDAADIYTGRKGGLGGPNVRLSSNAFGMTRVPYNNYPALLHEGERVLTKQEANQAKSGGSITIAKLADQIIVREEADIDRITDGIVTKIEKALVGYGGAY